MIGSNAVARRRASPRNPARAHPPSHPRNQQQGYWVAEPYLLSCFAHFGACASCSQKRTVCDSRNVPDTRVTSTVFFAGAVFQATFRVLTRPRFSLFERKKSLGPSIFSRDASFSARLDLTKRPDNETSFETRSPERGVREDHPQQAHRVQRGVCIRRVSRWRLGGARAALD